MTGGNQLILPVQILQPFSADIPTSTVQVTLRDLAAPDGFGVLVFLNQDGQTLPADPQLRDLHRAARISFFDAPAPGTYAIDIGNTLRRLQAAGRIDPTLPLVLTLESVSESSQPVARQRLGPPQASGATLLIPPPGK